MKAYSIFFAALGIISALPAQATVSFDEKMMVRAHVFGGYGLPAMTFLNNTYPQINNQGDIAFKVTAIDGTGIQGMFFKPNSKTGSYVYRAQEGIYLTEPRLTEQGQVVFSNTDELRTEGVFVFDPQQQTTDLEYSAKNSDIVYLANSHISDDGWISFRGTSRSGNRFIKSTKGSTEFVLEENSSLLAQPISYIFYPHFNSKNQIAVKVRLGESGEYGDKQPDRMLLVERNTEGLRVLDQVLDQKEDPSSQFVGFANGVHLSSDGKMSFIAYVGANKKKVIVVHDKGESRIVAQAGQDGIGDIESFTPVTNKHGLTVFRALNEKGLTSIYVSVQGKVQRYKGEGDSILTDLGTHSILHADGHTGIHGAPCLNDNNEFVFATTLTHLVTGDEIGNAVFKVKALTSTVVE